MASCVWTILAEYGEKANLDESKTVVPSKPSHELFDRMCNVYGWSFVSSTTLKEQGAQVFKFKLRECDLRKRGRVCGMIPIFKHKCEEYNHVEVVGGNYEQAIKLAKYRQFQAIKSLRRYLRPRSQVEVDGAAGEQDTQKFDAENTQVVEDTATEVNDQKVDIQDEIQQVSSTEKLYTFDSILDRYVPLNQITIDKSSVGRVAQYRLPVDLSEVACVSNTLPLEQMMYGDYDIEVMVKPNAQKFQAGLGLVSVLLDSADLANPYSGPWEMAMQRPSAWFDIAGTTAAKISLPFEYRRTFVRNLQHGQNCAGVVGGIYVTLQIFMASPINVASSQKDQVSLLPFLKISKANFAGMTYKVPVSQGPINVVRKFADFIKEHDSVLETISDLTGLDKPAALENVSIVVPVPRLHFPNSKGLSDATVMRLNPAEVTSMPKRCHNSIKHTTLYDIARTWGYMGSFEWSVDNKQGDLLYSFPLESANFSNPTDPTNKFTPTVPPPISAIARMFQLETGTREFRVRFASTGFHSGSVTITMEYGRTTANDDKCEPYSSYFETWDLGETKMFETGIPYIFDTPWRRLGCIPMFAHHGWGSTDTRTYRTGTLCRVNTRVVVRVANPLRCSNTVAETINCLCFIRAGSDWRVTGSICNNGLFEDDSTNMWFNFPSSRYPNVASATKITSTQGTTIKKSVDKGLTLSAVLAKEKKDKIARGALQIARDRGYVDGASYSSLEQTLTRERTIVSELQQREAECLNKQTLVSQRAEDQDRKYATEASLLKLYSTAVDTYGVKVNPVPDRELHVAAYPDYAVSGFIVYEGDARLVLQQKTMQKGYEWVFASSPRWERFSKLGVLLPTFRWAGLPVDPVVPKAQGLGDMSCGPIKFGPGKLEASTTLASSHSDSIWDVLKKPVCLMYQRPVKLYQVPHTLSDLGHNPYLIPIIPPQVSYSQGQYVWSQPPGDMRCFDPMVLQSPHVSLTSMFRWYRGSQRYTIVWYGSKPLYIQYLPKSGTRLLGNYGLIRGGGSEETPLDVPYRDSCVVNLGLTTEMLVPGVNPVAHIEVPYISENPWTPMNNLSMDTNYAWRDKADDCLGHLALIASEDANVDVWWAAGNDFRMGGFLGCLKQSRLRLVDTMDDDAPRAQAVFCETEGAPLGGLPSAQMMQCFNAVAGMAISSYTAWNVNRTVDRAAQVIPKIEQSASELVEVMLKSKEITGEIHNMVMGRSVDISRLSESIVRVGEGVIGKMENAQIALSVMLDLFMIWKIPDLTLVAGTLVRWFIQSGIVGISKVSTLVDATKKYLEYLFEPRAQGPEDVGPLTGFVCELLKATGLLKNIGSSVIGYLMDFLSEYCELRKLVTLGRTLESFQKFINGVISLVKMIWLYCFGRVDKDVKVYTMLTEKNETFLNFISEAQRMLSVGMREQLKVSPSERLKFYSTVQLACLIQKVMIVHPEVKVATPLLQLINKILKMADEVGVDLLSSPVRFEPLVVLLHGDTRIGKSYLTPAVVAALLNQVGWKGNGEPIYIRTPGQEFWNGYTNQPVVVFDDIDNVDETTANIATIADIFALKSSAAFNPNMARLEEKDKRGNPMIVILLTNNPFPKLAESADKTAYYSRRDIMYKVVCDQQVEKDHDFKHLKFVKYVETMPTPTSPMGKLGDAVLSYTDWVGHLCSAWGEYYKKEVKNVNYRWTQMLKSMKAESEQTLFDYDPYAVLTRHLFKADLSTGEGEQKVVEAMEIVFNKYCVEMELEGVMDFFTSEHLAKLKKISNPEAQGFLYPEKRPGESDKAWKRRVEHYMTNLVDDEDFFWNTWSQWRSGAKTAEDVKEVTRVFLDMMLFFRSKQFMKYVEEKTGFQSGVCSNCNASNEILVRRCCEVGGPLCMSGCDKGWCYTCVNSGQVIHGSHSNTPLTVPENYTLAMGVVVACIHSVARALCLPFRFAGYLFVRVMVNYTAYLECLGCSSILAGFISFLTGNFSNGCAYLTSGYLFVYSSQEYGAFRGPEKCDIQQVMVALGYQVYRNVATPYRALRRYILKLWGIEEPFVGTYYDGRNRDPELVRTYSRREEQMQSRLLSIEWMEKPAAQMGYKWVNTMDFDTCSFVPASRHKVDWGCCQHYDLFDIEIADPGEGTSDGSVYKPMDQSEFKPFEYNVTKKICTWPIDVRFSVNPSVMFINRQWEVTTDKGRLLVPNKPCLQTCILNNPWAVDKLLDEIANQPYFEGCYRDSLNNPDEVPILPYQFFEPSFVNRVWGVRSWYIDLWQSIKEYVFSDWWSWIKSTIGTFFSKCGVWLVMLAFGASLIWRVVKTLSVGEHEGVEEQSPREGKPKFAKKMFRRVGKAQASEDNVTAISNSVMSNQVILKIQFPAKSLEMCGLGIAQNFVLFPRHYWPIVLRAMVEGAIVTIARMLDNKAFSVKLVEDDFVVADGNDFMMWKAIPQVGIFKDIRNHFASVTYYENNSIASDGFLVIPPIRNSVLPTVQRVILSERLDQVSIKGMVEEVYDIVDVITYNFSMPGACGSPVYRVASVSPLLGIHVAGKGSGSAGIGYCPIVTRELLAEMIGECTVLAQASDNFGCLEDALFTFDEEVLVSEVGSVPPEMMIQQPLKSKIVKTLVAEDLQIDPVRVPVPLGPNEGVYAGLSTTPFYEGIKHHGELSLDLGSDVEKYMKSCVKGVLASVGPTIVKPEKLSIEESVVGKPDVEYYDPLDLQTSAGWPWCKKRNDTTKAPWITYLRDDNLKPIGAVVDQEVVTAVKTQLAEREQGLIQNSVFSDCMKDEKKDKTKLTKLGKTRIFCMSPLDLTIVVRMYFLHFMAAMMHNRLRIPSAVGIAPDSWEWGLMIDKLKRVNKNYCWTFDYHNFGPAFSIRAARASFEAMIDWVMLHVKGLTKKDRTVMECLMYEHINSLHLARNLIYRQGAGSPSGSALTAIINTLVNISYISWAGKVLLYAYWKAKYYKKNCSGGYDTPGEEAGFSDWFAKVFAYFCYGDDVVAASSDEIIHLFNAKTVAELFSKFNITATDGGKGEQITPYCGYSEMTFLKRGCLDHPILAGQYLAPVQWSVVQEAAYYTWKSEDLRVSTRENVLASVVLAYGHGPEKFGLWREQVNEAMRKRGLRPIMCSWEELDQLFYPISANGVVVRPTKQWAKLLVSTEWDEDIDLAPLLQDIDMIPVEEPMEERPDVKHIKNKPFVKKRTTFKNIRTMYT